MKYYIKTFGCQLNISDSERIAGFLEKSLSNSPFYKGRGFEPAEDINQADLVIFNTCGVRQSAEDRVYGQIHNLYRTYNIEHKTKIIVLTGCLANRKDVQKRLENKVDLFCEIKNFPEKIKKHVFARSKATKQSRANKDYLDTKGLLRYARNDKSYLDILPKYSNKSSAYVPIMTGCNNFCSYCVVPYARGREISRPVEEIIREIKLLVKNGCKEIILLGQNVNSYSYKVKSQKLKVKIAIKNSKVNFPYLLDYLAQSFQKMKFKFITSHPKDFSNELIKIIAKNKNISREIHLPVQAGSDKILKAMNRPYTQKKYLDLIKKIKKTIPEASFTTDVIVGFPGETEKDFQESVMVFEKIKFNEAYINKYSPRPGTAAWKLGNPVLWEEKKKREKTLRKLVKNK
jgi:tRNA-2-methylthio-N6-dimethylallyladenosine synthase